jgi:hypothetical protein
MLLGIILPLIAGFQTWISCFLPSGIAGHAISPPLPDRSRHFRQIPSSALGKQFF